MPSLPPIKLIFLLIMLFGQVAVCAIIRPSGFKQKVGYPNLLTISYGKNSFVIYNLQAGTFNVDVNGNHIISGAYSEAKNADEKLNSKNYAVSRVRRSVFTDAIGKGIKYVITRTKAGSPAMDQVFYTYSAKNYFFIEMLLKGTSLSSNYMAPLIAQNGDILQKGDNRTLFVPFDNDAFVRYNAREMNTPLTNTSAEVGTVYENNTRAGLVIGSVEHQIWKTGIKTAGTANKLNDIEAWGGYCDELVTRDKIPHGSITGSKIKSPKIFVGYFADWRNGMELYAKANRKIEPPFVFNWKKSTPVGWNSWGVLQEKIAYTNTTAVVNFFADSLKAFRSGNEAYIDLDSFWDNMVKGGMSGDFSPLKKFADYCKSKGLRPGAYWAPFTDWGWQSKSDRKAEGGNYNFSEMWTKVNNGYHDFDGARALDPTHPGTQKRIAFIIKKLKDCGFEMIKIDFLGHAAIESDGFYNRHIKTGMQAYRVGMEYLINQLDNQMLVYAAISPSLATARYAHMRRIACDAFHSVDNSRYTLNSINYGWWQTYAYNYIDADHVVFDNESAGANRIRLTSGLITGSLITGDNYSIPGPWALRAKELLQNPEVLKLIAQGVAFKPVDGNTGNQCGNYFIRRCGNALYLAVFSFNNEKTDIVIDLKRLGLSDSRSYHIQGIYQQSVSNVTGSLSVSFSGADAGIYKIISN